MSFLLGFLGSAAISSTAVLLTTPRSGKENTERLTRYVNDTKDSAENFTNALSQVTNQINRVKEEVERLQTVTAPEIERSVSSFTTSSKTHLENIEHTLSEIGREADQIQQSFDD